MERLILSRLRKSLNPFRNYLLPPILAVLRAPPVVRLLSRLRAPAELHLPVRTTIHSATSTSGPHRRASDRHRRGPGRRRGRLLLLELLDVPLARHPLVALADPPHPPAPPTLPARLRDRMLPLPKETGKTRATPGRLPAAAAVQAGTLCA